MRYSSAHPAVGPVCHRPDDIGCRRPDDTDDIMPSDFSRSGGLCRKWTGGALCARTSTAPLRPGGWITESGGSGLPYGGSTYSGVPSHSSPPVGSPMLPYSHYSPASAAPPHFGRRSPSGFIGTGNFPGTPSGLGLSPGFFPSASDPTSGALRTSAMAATLGSPAPGLGYTCAWTFPAYASALLRVPCGFA